MSLPATLSQGDLDHYHRAVLHWVGVRSHFDVLVWLQGDIQRYLPHDILIAAWGDFEAGFIQYDVVSALSGVRTKSANPATIKPLLLRLFAHWTLRDRQPFAILEEHGGFSVDSPQEPCALGLALKQMQSALVHGISDERGSHDCLYVTFSAQSTLAAQTPTAMAMMLPYIDMSLRQVAHPPLQTTALASTRPEPSLTLPIALKDKDLSDREVEVLHWVSLGKTNPEIGSILAISACTVKNHMQRVFKKLDVTNRAQAVGKLRTSASNV
ncbi:MAG: transcriptional regulator EpsA [Rhodoferax sp.]|nr:transcriptional regulator EpsA [Rhodoferax sp.]